MEHIWSKRFSTFINERVYILRRVANGYSILPLLLFLFGLYYYPVILEHWPENFPTELFLSLLIAWILTRGSFRSFIQEADILYLLPAEQQLKRFLRKSMIYNICVQCFGVFAVMVLLSPLFFAEILDMPLQYFVLVIIALVLKVCNLFCLWELVKEEFGSFKLIRWFLQTVFLYSLMEKYILLLVISTIAITLFGWFLIYRFSRNRLNWARLIEMDGQLNARFYQWMGYFVDHPHITSKVVQRKIFMKLTEPMRKKKKQPLFYLYLTLFLRSEVLGIVHRIVILGGILMIFIKAKLWIIGIYSILILIIGTQLIAFWQMIRYNFWPNLYPLLSDKRRKDFLTVAMHILYVYTGFLYLFLSIVSLELQIIGIGAVIGFILPYVFIRYYATRKLSYR